MEQVPASSQVCCFKVSPNHQGSSDESVMSRGGHRGLGLPTGFGPGAKGPLHATVALEVGAGSQYQEHLHSWFCSRTRAWEGPKLALPFPQPGSLRPAKGRRPRAVSKEWGGVSSFLAGFTLGLLFVEFRTFISRSGSTFHHQVIERL